MRLVASLQKFKIHNFFMMMDWSLKLCTNPRTSPKGLHVLRGLKHWSLGFLFCKITVFTLKATHPLPAPQARRSGIMHQEVLKISKLCFMDLPFLHVMISFVTFMDPNAHNV